MLHEEVGAVFLGRDGVGRGLGDEVNDFDVGDIELEAGGGAGVGANATGDDDGGLLGEGLDAVEDLRRDGGAPRPSLGVEASAAREPPSSPFGDRGGERACEGGETSRRVAWRVDSERQDQTIAVSREDPKFLRVDDAEIVGDG